jgi:replicative DNA helicase
VNLPTQVPPQALDAEQAVLAACLTDRRCVTRLLSDLQCEEFYYGSHQSMYRGIEALAAEGQLVDTVSLVEKLRQQGTLEAVGGLEYVKTVYGVLQNPKAIGSYIKPIQDAATRRTLIDVARSLDFAARESEQPGLELAEDFAMVLQATAQNRTVCEGRTARQAFSERGEQIRRGDKPVIIRLNQKDLDDVLTIHPGDLIVLAGVLNTGKSGTAMNWLLSACENSVETELWTLEMMEQEYLDRMIAAKSGIGASKITRGELSETEKELACEWAEWLGCMPLRIYEQTPNVEALRGQLRINASKHGTKLVFVDQLRQLNTRHRHESETLKLGYIAQQLKQSARENRNAVIVLHQFNRAGDDVGPPEIKHLRGSGMIAEDCDAIVMIYQPNRKEEHKKRQYADEVEMEWIIPRQRNGPKGSVKRTFRLSTQQIYEMSYPDTESQSEEPEARNHWE